MNIYEVLISKEARMSEYMVETSPEGSTPGADHIIALSREELIRLLGKSGRVEMDPTGVMEQLDRREIVLIKGVPESVAQLFQRRPA